MSAFHFQAQTVEKAKEACQLSFKEGSQKLPQDTFIYISLARIHSQDFIQFPGSLGGAVFSLYSHEYCWKSETPCPGKKREVGQPTIFAKLLSPQSSASASSQTLLPLESPRLTAMHISPSSSHVTLDQGLTFWPLLFVVFFFFYFKLGFSRHKLHSSFSGAQVCEFRYITQSWGHHHGGGGIWNITITPSSSSHCLDSKPLLPPPWQHWVDFCPHGFAFSRTSCKWNQSICSLLCLASLT